MGDLIVMTRPNIPVRNGAPKAGSANILFFTGVRYARVAEPDPALASVTPPKRTTKPRGPSKKGDMKRA